MKYGEEALKTLKDFAEIKDIDICAYLAKNGIDIDLNKKRIYEVMMTAERGDDRKEAAKKLFELDYDIVGHQTFGRQKCYRVNSEKESTD